MSFVVYLVVMLKNKCALVISRLLMGQGRAKKKKKNTASNPQTRTPQRESLNRIWRYVSFFLFFFFSDLLKVKT